MRRQDDTLGVISGTLNTLASQAGLIGHEVNEQSEWVEIYLCEWPKLTSARMLDDLGVHVDSTDTRLRKVSRTMQDFIRRNEGERVRGSRTDGRNEERMVYLHLDLCFDRPPSRGHLDMNLGRRRKITLPPLTSTSNSAIVELLPVHRSYLTLVLHRTRCKIPKPLITAICTYAEQAVQTASRPSPSPTCHLKLRSMLHKVVQASTFS